MKKILDTIFRFGVSLNETNNIMLKNQKLEGGAVI